MYNRELPFRPAFDNRSQTLELRASGQSSIKDQWDEMGSRVLVVLPDLTISPVLSARPRH